MANIFDVAKYILEQKHDIPTMKLQKLCYYVQVWHVVWEDAPIYNSEIQAFANGPVIKDLYDYHRGNFSIDSDFIKEDKLEKNLTNTEKDTIHKVLDFYSDKSTQWLSDVTHQETPWKQAREKIPEGRPSNNVISLESIMEYYTSISQPDSSE